MNYIVTKECHSRCVNCRIWETTPKEELQLAEVEKIARESPFLSWINFTGGEPTDCPDFVERVAAFARHCPDLLMVHFPTNGLRPDRVEGAARRIAELGIPKVYVTVSIDGPPDENDRLRGIPGDFRSAIETYRRLEKIRGIRAFVGMTLYPSNHRKIHETFRAIRTEIPGFSYRRFHVNLAHRSGHYYENSIIKKTLTEETIESLRAYRKARGVPFSPVDWIEDRFHFLSESYLKTGKTPLGCAALIASVFLTEKGEVYPCSIWDRPLGSLRDREYRIMDLIRDENARSVRGAIERKACENCWTPCEAFQSIAYSWGKKGSRS